MFPLAQLRSRRLLPIFIGVALTGLALYIIVRLLAFAQLFGKLGPHAGIEITQQEVFQLHNNVSDDPRPAFPRMIHQIFHNWAEPGNHELPEDWARMRQSCIDKNPGWEFKVCFGIKISGVWKITRNADADIYFVEQLAVAYRRFARIHRRQL